VAIWHYKTSVAGVSFANDDGASRQAIIENLKVGETLELIPEPSNKFDKYAVKVMTSNGEQIGYMPSRSAEVISDKIRKGEHKYTAVVISVGRPSGVSLLGVQILVIVAPASASAFEISSYLSSVILSRSNESIREHNNVENYSMDTESIPGRYKVAIVGLLIFLGIVLMSNWNRDDQANTPNNVDSRTASPSKLLLEKFNKKRLATTSQNIYPTRELDSSIRIGRIPKGVNVVLLEISGDMVKIEYEGMTGWVPRSGIEE